MAVKSASMLDLGWQEFGKIARDAKAMEESIESLEKIWTKWLGSKGEQTGGRLTKKMAAEFANYLRQDIYSGKAFRGMIDLSDRYKLKKARLGYDPNKIGIASGTLVESISIMDQGYSKFRVGIPRGVVNRDGLGNIQEVWKYATLLEHGYKRGPGSHQPPRPFMMVTFNRWINDKAPDHVAETVDAEIKAALSTNIARMAAYVPKFDAEDYLSDESPEFFGGEQGFQLTRASGGAPEEIESYSPLPEMGRKTPKTADLDKPIRETTIPGVTADMRKGVASQFDKNLNAYVNMYNEVWNEHEERWQDFMEYMNRIYGTGY